MHETASTVLNRWVAIVEHPVIYSDPNTPCHEDNNFHEERLLQTFSDSLKNLM